MVNSLALWGIVALVVAATTVIVVAAAPLMFRDLGALQRDDQFNASASRRRVVVEFVVVALALVGVVLMRRRGLVTGGSDGSFDPLLAAAPVLLALAVGIVMLRLYVYPIRWLAWIGSLRRDAVMFVGFRRILQQPAAARLPLIVVLAAVAVAVFASVMHESIDRGQAAAAWQEVGADYRITGANPGAPLPAGLDLATASSIEAAAPAWLVPSAFATGQDSQVPRGITVLGVDASSYNEVALGSPGHLPLSVGALRMQSSPELGTAQRPIPALVSRRWLPDATSRVGQEFTLSLGRVAATFVVTEVRERIPGLPPDRPFVLADLVTLSRVAASTELPTTMLYVRAADGLEPELTSALEDQTGELTLASRRAVYEEIREAPFVTGVSRALQISIVVATVFAIVAALSALALTSRLRRRDLGRLRTVGSSPRQTLYLTLIEQLPPIAIASVVGTLLGIGIAVLFESGIELQPFTGSGLSPGLHLDPLTLLIVNLALLAALVIAAIVWSARNRTDSLAELLRMGEE